MLTMSDIHRGFAARGGTVQVLAGAALHVPSGTFACLTGASGSGKSTLLHIAAGLLRPDRGEISVAGLTVSTMDEGERAAMRRNLVGILFQRDHLLPFLELLPNTCIGGADPAIARGMLERMGLGARLRHLPGELSAGERERGALVRALAGHPRLILADEPTASLDAEHGRVVINTLLEAAAGGAAVLIASHDPAVLAAANLRLALKAGHICTT